MKLTTQDIDRLYEIRLDTTDAILDAVLNSITKKEAENLGIEAFSKWFIGELFTLLQKHEKRVVEFCESVHNRRVSALVGSISTDAGMN